MNITITASGSGHVGTRITEIADVFAVRRDDAQVFKPSMCDGVWYAPKKTEDCRGTRSKVEFHFDVSAGFELCGLCVCWICMLVLRV